MDRIVRIDSYDQKDGILRVILPSHPCLNNAYCEFKLERFTANSYNLIPIQGLAGFLKGIEFANLIHQIFCYITDAQVLRFFLRYETGCAYSYNIEKTINNNPCDYYEPILQAITVDMSNPHHGKVMAGRPWEVLKTE